MAVRVLSDASAGFRAKLANIASIMFGGKRDMYRALGYQRELTVHDYRSRFMRNAVANRVVKAFPMSTWRGGADIIEDDDPTVQTAFEAAWDDLQERLNIWSVFQAADILAGIGRYAVIVIGAPGNMDEPLINARPEEIVYLTPYGEDDARIAVIEADETSPRFGRPLFYQITRNSSVGTAVGSVSFAKRVHWTRVLHIAEGTLDDPVYGEPRLQCVWNLMDDLEKVTGGGAEAFWKRADGGVQFELDPELKLDKDQKKGLAKQVDEYEHDLRRTLLTRGVKINPLGSEVADFSRPVDSIISQISAGTGIPQRVLMGSEQAKLASQSDRTNFDERVEARRGGYAATVVVRQAIDRFVAIGALPAPAEGTYDVAWTQLRVMDDVQRAAVAASWATINQNAGETVVLPDEIRERALDLPPLKDVVTGPVPQPRQTPGQPPAAGPKAAAARKGEAEWAHVLRSADRFRRARTTYRQRRLRRRAQGAQPEQPASGTQE